MVSTLPNDPVNKQPHPVNQITPVSKYLALALFVMLPFVGAYVGYQLAPEKVVEVSTIKPASDTSKQNLTNIPEVKKLLSVFTDDKIGFQFSHPSEWGEVIVDVEKGTCPENYSKDTCDFMVYKFSQINNLTDVMFLTIETQGHEMYPVGRGAFWGDEAGKISSSYLDVCANSKECSVMENENTISFAKYRTVLPGYEVDPLNFDNVYHVYRNNSPYSGYLMTPGSFKSLSPDIEQKFESTVVNTFKFI